MRVKTAIRKIKKHNANGKPLHFYDVDRKSDFYWRIINYVMKHNTFFDFQLYTKEQETLPMDEDEWYEN